MHLQRAGVATILTQEEEQEEEKEWSRQSLCCSVSGGLSQWKPVCAVTLLSSALPSHQQLKSEQEKTFASFLKEVLPLVSSLLSLCD